MGKKSKRRAAAAGGGGKRNTARPPLPGPVISSSLTSSRDQRLAAPRRPVAGDDRLVLPPLLFSEPDPNRSARSRLRGVISTNDDPFECAWCSGEVVLGRPFFALDCCGKRSCPACLENAEASGTVDTMGFGVDLLGDMRCNFCNALKAWEFTILRNDAKSGKPWAQYQFGGTVALEGALLWTQKAAAQGHPEAFLRLSDMYLRGCGCTRNLGLAEAYVRQARRLHSHPVFWMRCNKVLVDIADKYLCPEMSFEMDDKAKTILDAIVSEGDASAIDLESCTKAAATLSRIREYHSSGEMYARSFCLGRIESALSVCGTALKTKKYALCRLWLSIACRTKEGYGTCLVVRTGTQVSWSDLMPRRDHIRSALREIRNSCGGCGTVLEGKMRKYCRGCRAYCYCGRECQKLHWNRSKDGHRDECKEAQEHKHCILEAIKSGNIQIPTPGKQETVLVSSWKGAPRMKKKVARKTLARRGVADTKKLYVPPSKKMQSDQ